MDTPIVDFVNEYCKKQPARFHMPGHKGVDSILGIEHLDITEMDGAGNLWAHGDDSCENIVLKSEANASKIFDCPTFYSTEGSSLAIRGMIFLVKKWAHINGRKPLILAGRNAHKTFVNTTSLLDIPVKYMSGQSGSPYVSCNITASDVEKGFEDCKPVAVFITTPDYLGNMLDVADIARVCHENGVFLIVDNAHGSYLSFVKDNEKSLHPIKQGADMCCDSAHKTLNAITGAAYLHVSDVTDEFFIKNAKNAMEIFATTSPSYLILQSLDLCNKYLAGDYPVSLGELIEKIDKAKQSLHENGYHIIGTEKIKLTIDTADYGYTGAEVADILRKDNIYTEYYDDDYIVFMMSTNTSDEEIDLLCSVLLSIPKKKPLVRDGITDSTYSTNQMMSPYEALMSDAELVGADESVGRILAEPAISCPPCVPLYFAGDQINVRPDKCEWVRVVK